MWMVTGLVALVLGVASGQAVAAEPAGQAGGYGLSHANPVEACRHTYNARFFSRLTCPSGERPAMQRRGSIGPRTPYPEGMSQEQTVRLIGDAMKYAALAPGEADHHILEAYEATCGDTHVTFYLDAYHCRSAPEVRAPAGLLLTRYDPVAGKLEAARSLVLAMRMDTWMERVAGKAVGRSDGYYALADRYGEEKATQMAKEEIARMVPLHIEAWRLEAATVHARHFTDEELLSLALDLGRSPHAARFEELYPRITEELQALLEPRVDRLLAEALRNAHARE